MGENTGREISVDEICRWEKMREEKNGTMMLCILPSRELADRSTAKTRKLLPNRKKKPRKKESKNRFLRSHHFIRSSSLDFFSHTYIDIAIIVSTMPVSLNKVHKHISKKRGTIGALHENSRDAKRLRRANARDDRVSRVHATMARGRQSYSTYRSISTSMVIQWKKGSLTRFQWTALHIFMKLSPPKPVPFQTAI